MNKLINPRIQLCLIAAIGAAILLANPAPSLAQAPHAKRTPGPTRPTPPPQNGELKLIQARASVGAAKIKTKDANAIKEVNAELAGVHADLVAYAQKNGFKVSAQTFTHPVAASTSCAGTVNKGNVSCTLTKAELTNGYLVCHYDCVVVTRAK